MSDSLQKQLLNKAKSLGLNLHNRTGAPKLLKIINNELRKRGETTISENDFEVEETSFETVEQKTVEESPSPLEEDHIPPEIRQILSQKVTPMTEEDFFRRQEIETLRTCGKLVRCRITCMNPHKKNWTGEIVSVGSSKAGTFKKLIPFNLEEPYHLPKIIFDFLKEKKCRIGTTVRLPNGQEVNRYKLVNEYALEVLDPLSPEELEDLAQRQAMAQGTA